MLIPATSLLGFQHFAVLLIDSDFDDKFGSDFWIEIWFDYNLVWNIRTGWSDCLSLIPGGLSKRLSLLLYFKL